MLMPMPTASPYLEITEQPKQRGMRFRYECEGRSAGSIPGDNTTQDRKSWPTVQIKNYHGEALIRVSLVSKDQPPRPHPHSLVGKDCENGICQVRVSPETQMTAVFSNLGIQCMKRKEVADSLQERRRLGVDPYNTSSNTDPPSVDIDLNIVRLCFEAFIQRGNQHQRLPPVVSNAIFDKKATCSALLRICRVDKSFGSCKGGDEVYLLCDKVQKDDISICFFNIETGWESYGEFSPTDVHRQVAIVFRTPPYKHQDIREATKVMFKLKRTSDGQTSDAKDFTYLPLHHDQPHVHPYSKKRPLTFGFGGPSQSAKALRKHLEEKVPAPHPLPPYMPRLNQRQMPAQFPGDIFRHRLGMMTPPVTQNQLVPVRQPLRAPATVADEEVLDQFLNRCSASTPPYSPNPPASPFTAMGDMRGTSMQYTMDRWMPASPANMPSSSMQYPNSSNYMASADPRLQPRSTSGLQGVATSSRNYESVRGADMTSIDQITPTLPNVNVEDLGPGITSIGSLNNVSFNLDTPLDDSMKALSIEEDIIDIIKQEPITEPALISRGQAVQSQMTFLNPSSSVAFPMGMQTQVTTMPNSNAPQQRPNMLQAYDLEASIPSFDLNDPQGNFSIDASQGNVLDDLVSKSETN